MKYKLRSATMNNERFQKPDLLLALKANPKWKEVQQNEENQQIIHRVFDLKLKQLTTDITEKHILGQPTAPLEIVKICPKTNPLAYILVPLNTIPRTKIQTSFMFFRYRFRTSSIHGVLSLCQSTLPLFTAVS